MLSITASSNLHENKAKRQSTNASLQKEYQLFSKGKMKHFD